MSRNNFLKKSFAVVLSLLLLVSNYGREFSIEAKDYECPENGQIQVDDHQAIAVKFLDYDYENNYFISLRELAVALSGTTKEFDVAIDSSSVSITTGVPYGARGGEGSPWSREQLQTWYTINQSMTPIKIDGKNVKYFTFLFNMGSYYDCFMSALDVAMLFDLHMEYEGESCFIIDTDKGFSLDMAEVEGYFQNVNAVYVGDATTGETFFNTNPEGEYAMASTTKLMTCLLTLEAVSEGRIAMEDRVSFSQRVDDLSHGTDKVLPLYLGNSATVKELLAGCLLPSSNEAALALAEYLEESEEAFVDKMNQKAAELGMTHTFYYNCHGLPFYTRELMPVKIQNYSSSRDLFILASYIVNNTPEILEITQAGSISLPSVGMTVTNTNFCLYNVKEMVGLKTGTTDKAGYCLVTASRVAAEDGEHFVITVLLGAGSNYERTRISEVMARYGIDRVKKPGDYKPFVYEGIENNSSLEDTDNSKQPGKAGELLNYCIRNLEF